MYCKFCGAHLLPNVLKCPSCGASINFKDGGQTFFEDNELDEWRVESPVQPPVTTMPTPEIQKTKSVNRNSTSSFTLPVGQLNEPMPAKTMSVSSRSNSKKRKKYTLTTNGKLIGGCIIIALLVVLLAAAITAVINNTNDGDDTPTDAIEAAAEITLVDGARIIINGTEVAAPGNVYLLGDIVFVSMNKVLEHANFTYEPTEDSNVVRYVRESGTETISVEVVQGTKEMRFNGNNSELMYNSFAVSATSDTYVPAESLFEKLGYTISYFESTKILAVETRVR